MRWAGGWNRSITDWDPSDAQTRLAIPEAPDGMAVTGIGKSGWELGSLEKRQIMDSVTSIGEDAFYMCPGFSLIVVSGSHAAQYAEDNDIKCTYFSAGERWNNGICSRK